MEMLRRQRVALGLGPWLGVAQWQRRPGPAAPAPAPAPAPDPDLKQTVAAIQRAAQDAQTAADKANKALADVKAALAAEERARVAQQSRLVEATMLELDDMDVNYPSRALREQKPLTLCRCVNHGGNA